VASIVGAWSLYSGASIYIPAASLLLAIISFVSGTRLRKEIQQKEQAIHELLSEKSNLRSDLDEKQSRVQNLKSDLEQQREKKERFREERKRENQRLKNLKRILKNKGIDTSYLVDKYDSSLYAPVMVLTHFNSPNHNSESEAEVINENLDALDADTLHGATKIIPPRNFDQDVSRKEELRDWFDEEILDGETDLSHRLEFLSIVDINQVFDRDNAEDDDGGYPANTVSDLFDTDTVVPTEELLDILVNSDRISIEDEIRQNVALLAVSSASKQQMDEIISNQTGIQDDLGTLTEIANTDPDRVGTVLSKYGVADSDKLAQSIVQEANRLNDILE